MKKRWWIGGAVAVVLAGAGIAVGTGLLKLPGTELAAKTTDTKAANKDGKDSKPEVTLEFVTQEVVQPSRAKLVSVIEFSGPLVAPQTAFARARAGGTLLSLSVGTSDQLSYAWVDGGDHGHAVVDFDGKAIPAAVLERIAGA